MALFSSFYANNAQVFLISADWKSQLWSLGNKSIVNEQKNVPQCFATVSTFWSAVRTHTSYSGKWSVITKIFLLPLPSGSNEWTAGFIYSPGEHFFQPVPSYVHISGANRTRHEPSLAFYQCLYVQQHQGGSVFPYFIGRDKLIGKLLLATSFLVPDCVQEDQRFHYSQHQMDFPVFLIP